MLYLLVLYFKLDIIYHRIKGLVLDPASSLGPSAYVSAIIIFELKHNSVSDRLFPHLSRSLEILTDYLSRFSLHKTFQVKNVFKLFNILIVISGSRGSDLRRLFYWSGGIMVGIYKRGRRWDAWKTMWILSHS